MELRSLVVKWMFEVERHFYPQYCGVVDRRRMIAYLLFTFCELAIIPYHLILFLWLKEPWGLSLTLVHLALFTGLQFAIWTRKISFVKGISCFYLLFFSKLAVDSVFSVLFGSRQDELSVVGDVFIMFILSIAALSQLLYKTSLAISLGLIPVIVFYFANNPVLFSLFSAKAIFVGFIMNVYVAVYNMKVVTKGLRQPHRVNSIEQRALNMLADLKDKNDDRAGNLIARLEPDLRQNIISTASEHLRKEELDRVVWDHICEGLTNSEKEICKLILQGKTLKEVCTQLGKSESNVTSQRCHIRKKLNMDRKADLKRTLEIRFFEAKKAASVS